MGGDQVYDVFVTSKSVIFKSNGLEDNEADAGGGQWGLLRRELLPVQFTYFISTLCTVRIF